MTWRTNLALANALAVLLAISGHAAADERSASSLRVDDLRCEYLVDPLGIDARAPRLSWKLAAVQPGARSLSQSAYQVLVAPDLASLREDKGALWDSGKVVSDKSLHVPYAGKALTSHATCWWKARAWDQDGKVSAWSVPARWTMGLLDPRDWSARWIGWDGGEETIDQSGLLQASSWIWYPGGKPSVGAPIGTRYFRRSVSLSGDRLVRKAQLFLGADDSFVAHVNGRLVGGGQGWAEVKIFDVTGQIRQGLNIVAVAATNSASPTVGPDKNPAGLIGLLKIEFDAGEPLLVPTNALARRATPRSPAGTTKPSMTLAGRSLSNPASWVQHRGARSVGQTTAGCPRVWCVMISRSSRRFGERQPMFAVSAFSTCT